MDIKTLKQSIIDKTLNNNLLIFKYSDSKILVNMYISEILKLKQKEKIYIKNLDEGNSDFFDIDTFYIYILNVDTFDQKIDPTLYDNYIIVCKNIESNLDLDKYIVQFPKIESWQIIDYAQNMLPGLNSSEIEWLYSICKNNERFIQEVDKLKIFNKDLQASMFTLIDNENGYSDLNNLNIYNFTNAILKKDINIIKNILINFDNIDIEPTGVVTILYNNFKNILNIQMNPAATAASLNMSDKQFNAIKYYKGYYTNKQLMDNFEFITSLDNKLKSGKFSLSRKCFVEFVLNKILKGVI